MVARDYNFLYFVSGLASSSPLGARPAHTESLSVTPRFRASLSLSLDRSSLARYTHRAGAHTRRTPGGGGPASRRLWRWFCVSPRAAAPTRARAARRHPLSAAKLCLQLLPASPSASPTGAHPLAYPPRPLPFSRPFGRSSLGTLLVPSSLTGTVVFPSPFSPPPPPLPASCPRAPEISRPWAVRPLASPREWPRRPRPRARCLGRRAHRPRAQTGSSARLRATGWCPAASARVA